jgi:hypothetical protein
MPHKGKPFVKGDPRRRNSAGRPKKNYREAMRLLAHGEGDDPSAIEVIKHHLRRNSLSAAQDVLNRAYGRPKEMVGLEGGSTLQIILPEPIAKRYADVIRKRDEEKSEPGAGRWRTQERQRSSS